MRRTGSASIGNVDGVNTRSDPEEFVTKFAGFWEDPSPQRLSELLHPNVVLVQPLAARMIGIQAHKQSSNASGPAFQIYALTSTVGVEMAT
jgi:hypothetical protein